MKRTNWHVLWHFVHFPGKKGNIFRNVHATVTYGPQIGLKIQWTWCHTPGGLNVTVTFSPPSIWGWTKSFWTHHYRVQKVTWTKRFWDPVSLGLNVWVELSLGPKVGGLNIKAPKFFYFTNSYWRTFFTIVYFLEFLMVLCYPSASCGLNLN